MNTVDTAKKCTIYQQGIIIDEYSSICCRREKLNSAKQTTSESYIHPYSDKSVQRALSLVLHYDESPTNKGVMSRINHNTLHIRHKSLSRSSVRMETFFLPSRALTSLLLSSLSLSLHLNTSYHYTITYIYSMLLFLPFSLLPLSLSS